MFYMNVCSLNGKQNCLEMSYFPDIKIINMNSTNFSDFVLMMRSQNLR